MSVCERAMEWVRLAAERAALIRLNAGYGFASGRPLYETFLRSDDARERLGRDALRPRDTHVEQLAVVERELARARKQWGAGCPLFELCDRLDLGELERDLLCAAVGVAVDVDIREMCVALGATSRATLTGFVCQEVFPTSCADGLAVAASLTEGGTLVRNRLLTVSGRDGLDAALVVGEDVLATLAGDRTVPPRLAALVDSSGDASDCFLPEEIEQRIAAVSGTLTDSPVVFVVGPQGSGKRAIAEALARRLERTLIAVNGAGLDGASVLLEVLALGRQRDQLVYVAAVETIEDPAARRALDDHDDVLLLGSRDSGAASLRRPAQIISAPRPTLETRVLAWRAGLTDAGTVDPSEAETLAARYVIGVGAISEVFSDAKRYAAASQQPLATGHLEDAVSRRLSLNLGVLGQRITRQASFEEMVLPGDVFEVLRDLIAMVKGRSTILETWGYARHLGLSRGVAALFSGGPGTGKTMAASVVSSELGLELFRIDLSSVVSKWVGETEKNLAKIFDEAQDAHAMLLFDEADSLFGKRTDVQNASDRYANLEVNYVLQRMEQFDGISILTTNLESGIDPAFMRRLNFRVRFPDPEEEERAELWRKLLPPQAGLGEVDVSDLAERFEMTGGHIRNAIVRAAVVAAREGREMVKEDLERGAHHEYYELGKVMHSSL